MRRITRIVKRLIVAVALVALFVVLFPKHTEPLWNWAKVTGNALGHDPFPAFQATQTIASVTLLVFVVGGIVYVLWQDRRMEVLQAEYAFQTGATHLREKVQDLESQLKRISSERDAWQEKYATLNRAHTEALVAGKEHEIRSQYGHEDRQELQELRRRFEELLQKKGNSEGFRVAMDLMMADLSQKGNETSVSAHADNGIGRDDKNRSTPRGALSFDD